MRTKKGGSALFGLERRIHRNFNGLRIQSGLFAMRLASRWTSRILWKSYLQAAWHFRPGDEHCPGSAT